MAQTVATLTISSIGTFHGPRHSKSAIPRQGFLSQQTGYIEFEKGFDHKLAMTGLDQMSHIWVIYHFHEANSPAKPLVRPPRAPDKQVGVYATRSPYRPNGLGLTLAKIEKVENGRLYLSQVDLLDQTPVFDLKPYVTDSDRPQNPRLGWIDEIETWTYTLSDTSEFQCEWLSQNGLSEVYDVLEAQLGTNPLQPDRKRLEALTDNTWRLAYRTWRLLLKINTESRSSEVLELHSGYSDQDMNSQEDPYQDKDLHRRFRFQFKKQN